MSRCYPFPPPGYAGKCSSHEALILSIKLQKERERAISDSGAEKLIPEKSKSSSEKRKDKEDRKKDKKSKEERKKEKKEKRRDKKHNKDSAPFENGKLDNVVKLSKDGNLSFESRGKLELQRSSTEFMERSIVTEEHGQPIDSQNASCSSDSTGNSGKRKKLAASPSGIQSNGNIIRIRFSSSQKRDEPSTSGSKEQEAGPVPHPTAYSHVQPGVSFVKLDSSLKNKDVINNGLPLPPPQNTTTLKLDSLKDKTTEIAFQKEKLSSHDKKRSSKSSEKLSSREKKKLKKESSYRKLFVEWVPPQLERTLVYPENNDDDEEWLFGKKGDEDRSAKRLRTSEESQSQNLGDSLPCSASAVLQPCAHFLADMGVYALPFTVPF